ncbi:MAG: hypothetical protein WCH40_00410 [Verrucomicrobiales bacterium]
MKVSGAWWKSGLSSRQFHAGKPPLQSHLVSLVLAATCVVLLGTSTAVIGPFFACDPVFP